MQRLVNEDVIATTVQVNETERFEEKHNNTQSLIRYTGWIEDRCVFVNYVEQYNNGDIVVVVEIDRGGVVYGGGGGILRA